MMSPLWHFSATLADGTPWNAPQVFIRNELWPNRTQHAGDEKAYARYAAV
jgi:hypothetical protein